MEGSDKQHEIKVLRIILCLLIPRAKHAPNIYERSYTPATDLGPYSQHLIFFIINEWVQ